MSSEKESKFVVNDFEIDVEKQTILMVPSQRKYEYTWLADGGIVAIEWRNKYSGEVKDIHFVKPSAPIVVAINSYILEREVLHEQNKQR